MEGFPLIWPEFLEQDANLNALTYGIKPIIVGAGGFKRRGYTDVRDVPQQDDRRLSLDGIAGARTQLIAALETVLRERGLNQVSAARLLQTDQPTLSKVLRGRTESVSLDKLMEWLLVLGRSVEIHVVEGLAQGGALRVMASEHADAPR